MSKVVRVIMIMTFRKDFADSEDVDEIREFIVDYDTGSRRKFNYYPPHKVRKAIGLKKPDFRCEIYRDTLCKIIRKWDIKYD